MDPDDEKVLDYEGGTDILGGQPEVDIHNISFDESHQRVVQS